MNFYHNYTPCNKLGKGGGILESDYCGIILMAKNSELSVLIRWRRSTRSCTISGVIVNSSKKECFELFQFLTVTLEEGMNFLSI